MLDRFVEAFAITDRVSSSESPENITLAELQVAFGGCTFAHGLYRLHTPSSAVGATDLVEEAFPEFRGRTACFGFDWMGRQFALDLRQAESDQAPVLLLEPGTGEALEIPVPFADFHDTVAVEYSDAVFASAFFAEWKQGGGATPEFDQCIGYKTPLFLGGADAVDNLEVSDFEVYWSICGQLRTQAAGLAPGTRIGEVVIDE